MGVDVWKYRNIILGGLNPDMYVLAPFYDLDKYSGYTKYVQTSYDFLGQTTFMVGYNIKTIDGEKWMPVFCHYYGQIRNKLNYQFLIKYREKQLNVLSKVGFPAVVIRIISKYF